MVATDVDGTLLDGDSQIGRRTRAALIAAHAAGILVVPATGRPPQSVWPLVEGLPMGPAAVCSNGAVVADLVSRTHLEVSRIAGPVAAGVVARLRRAVPGVTFAVDDLDCFTHEAGFFDRPVAWDEEVVRPVADVGVALDAGCVKLIARRPGWAAAELLAQVTGHLGAGTAATTSGLDWVDIGLAGVTKASALARLCARLGVTPAEVVAVGDNHNDLAALAWAGTAMAPANAVAEVLAQVDRVLPPNTAEGVADLLEELVA